MIPYKQLSLADIFADCQNKFEEDKPAFLKLLETYINLDEIVPVQFINHYYLKTGRNREYPLYAMLWALILQKIFSIPTDSLLLVILEYSKPLRDFCGFSKVPDASKITRFKQDFLPDLQSLFNILVDVTEPICQNIDSAKASMTIFDSSGIEAFVKENNPKHADRIIKQLKAYAKSKGYNKSFDPYKAAYGSMPSCAGSEPEVKQLYINGHFCYAYKFGIVTNGLGIVRHIGFYDKNYYNAHPEIVLGKKSGSPDEDKSVHDARLLIPTLKDFFKAHPLINPGTFIGDSAFDSVMIYKELLSGDTFGIDGGGGGIHFSKAFIPLNRRSKLENVDYTINDDGIPCCPNNPNLPMKYEGTCKLKSGVTRFKFVCPKIRWVHDRVSRKNHRECQCENPCTTSSCGRMIYLYPEKDLRAYPGTVRGTDEWDKTYKTRGVIEQTINHFKDNLCIKDRKTRNAKTLHADLLLSGITQLLTVLVANEIGKPQYLRSMKRLIS